MALRGVQHYKSEEPRLFYLKGWSEQLDVIDVTAECVAAALPQLANDIESIENLLQKYALRVILLECSEKDLQHRLNRTLNIQWAIDIKNSFSDN